jgi:transcriptional regulator with XRE-family HTH domain
MQKTPELEQFGAHLKELRLARGFSQEELGAVADLNTKYISDMERGLRNPSLDVVRRLAKGLQVDTAELVGDHVSQLDRNSLISHLISELSAKSDEELRAMLRISRAQRLHRNRP